MHPQALFSFTLFGQTISVYLYGIMTALGIVACLIVFYLYTKKKNMSTKVQDFSFFVIIVAVAVGYLFAKLYQTFYDWVDSGVWDFYHSGITAMGGFIGGTLAFIATYFGVGALYFKGKDKGIHVKEFEKILCVAPCCITIAHAFGRIGCLMAGCCHGRYLGTEKVFGGIYMYNSPNGYYVPTQLYESIFLFALFAVLSVFYFKKYRRLNTPIYLIGYGVWRFVIEIFRTDERGGKMLGMQPSQFQSVIFVLAGVAVLLYYIFKKIPLVIDDTTFEKENEKKDDENNDESLDDIMKDINDLKR